MRLSVEEYLAAVLRRVEPLTPVMVPAHEAHGLTLARSVTAASPVPPFTNAAMDGYAVRYRDLQLTASLPVAFDVPAGCVPPALPPGHAARIMTGAMLPADADTVVRVEDTDQEAGRQPLPERVRVLAVPPTGANVRRRGENVDIGALILDEGARLDAAALSAIISVGHGEILVRPRPRVAVLATGAELVAPGAPLSPGHIPDSNGALLSGLVTESGAQVVRSARVSDNVAAFQRVLETLVGACDLVITAGGISAGAYEVVRQATEPLGASFGHVAMQPGGPQGGGVLNLPEGRLPLLALPGNPVSVFVSFHRFARPLLARLSGSACPRATVTLRAGASWPSPVGKVQHVPVVVRNGALLPAHEHGSASHFVASLPRAEGLALVPANTATVRVGDQLEFLPTKDIR